MFCSKSRACRKQDALVRFMEVEGNSSKWSEAETRGNSSRRKEIVGSFLAPKPTVSCTTQSGADLLSEVDESNAGFDEYQQEKKKRKAIFTCVEGLKFGLWAVGLLHELD